MLYRIDDIIPACNWTAFAISGAKPAAVKINGRELGFIYEDEFARYRRLSGIHPENLEAGRPEQAREVFETMDTALKKNGFAFTDTVRTWFSLSRLLEWYNEFNAVRTTFFSQAGIFERMVPASIDARGQSVHAGDPARQIELTMKVVEELLRSRGMDWNDLFRGIAYFKTVRFSIFIAANTLCPRSRSLMPTAISAGKNSCLR